MIVFLILLVFFVAMTIPGYPAIAAEPSSRKADIKPGDTISFGRYEQDNDGTNGAEPIEWLVLEVSGGKALLLSQYGLDIQVYNIIREDVTWETCSLRSWCNGYFLNAAFSSEEQDAVLLSAVDNSKAQGNPWSKAKEGKDTYDKVFLLSYAEVEKYFDKEIDYESQHARICLPTQYAADQGAYEDWEFYHDYGEACTWWLRSPGWPDFDDVSPNEFAAFVSVSGEILTSQVDEREGWYILPPAVRPALWLDLNNTLWETGVPEIQESISTETGAAQVKAEIHTGDRVFLGHYEQDKNTSNGKEPIEWQVLEVQEDRVLLVSTYILDAVTYNRVWVDMTWEHCSLRTWLNGTFINEAFSAEEQSIILSSLIDNSNEQGNSEWDTYGGKDTLDRVFLLSFAEAKKYFATDSIRRCRPTAYSDPRGISEYTDGYGYWWLRSPGSIQSDAEIVGADGSIGWGFPVFDDGAGNGVRPAIWIAVKT